MTKRPERIDETNALNIDIPSIAQDRRFVDLSFHNTKTQLPKVQAWLSEADQLGAASILNDNDLHLVQSTLEKLVTLLNELLSFESRTTKSTAPAEHKKLEANVQNFYNKSYERLPKNILQFLRQETARQATDSKELEKQIKAAAEARQEYERLNVQISDELEAVRSKKKEVETEQGALVAVGLGKDFDDQSAHYQKKATSWLMQRTFWLILLFTAVIFNWLLFLCLLAEGIDPGDIFTPQYGTLKLTLLLLLSYAVGFCSRNYNINSGLAATNRHRKNVAEVLQNALSSTLSDEAKSYLTQHAANEMFRHLPVGYISKEHQSDNGPFIEAIRRSAPTKSE